MLYTVLIQNHYTGSSLGLSNYSDQRSQAVLHYWLEQSGKYVLMRAPYGSIAPLALMTGTFTRAHFSDLSMGSVFGRARAMGGAYCARKTLLPSRSFPLLAGGQSCELCYLGRRLLDCSPCGPEAPACGPQVET